MKNIYVALYDLRKKKSTMLEGKYQIVGENMELYNLRIVGDVGYSRDTFVFPVEDYKTVKVKLDGLMTDSLVYITESKKEAKGKLSYLELLSEKVLTN